MPCVTRLGPCVSFGALCDSHFECFGAHRMCKIEPKNCAAVWLRGRRHSFFRGRMGREGLSGSVGLVFLQRNKG